MEGRKILETYVKLRSFSSVIQKAILNQSEKLNQSTCQELIKLGPCDWERY